MFTCISCRVVFEAAEEQRSHFATDWHRYNMKRRVANLPPLPATSFNEKPAGESNSSAVLTISKQFATENAFRSHVQSKKHREREIAYARGFVASSTSAEASSSSSIPGPSSQAEESVSDTDSEDDLSDEDGIDQKIAASRRKIDPTDCLFCSNKSPSIANNVSHMARGHSFFIPDQENLIDLSGLLTYLGEKVAIGNICLYCPNGGKEFGSLEAVRRHMMDKAHCKLAYNSDEDRAELADFYDFAVVDQGGDWEDIDMESDEDEMLPTLAADGLSLVLPSGRVLGHRSLKVYYSQHLRPAAPADTSQELVTSKIARVRQRLADPTQALVPVAGGHGGFGKGLQVVKARNAGEARWAKQQGKSFKDQRIREDHKTKVGFVHNSQKHFRDRLRQEGINVLPGWAVKKVRKKRELRGSSEGTDAPFDLHISTLGFCTFVRDPSSISRTQRAFMRLAKSFAALPRLPPTPVQTALASSLPRHMPRSTDNPTNSLAGQRPKDVAFESLQRVRDSTSTAPPSSASLRPTLSRRSTVSSDVAFSNSEELSAAHENLDLRLRPFWSNVLPSRRIALSIYTVPLLASRESSLELADPEDEPLLRTTFTTNSQGHFAHTLVVPWERICTHPPTLPMVFPQTATEISNSWGLYVKAELLAECGPNGLRPSSRDVPNESSFERGTSVGTVDGNQERAATSFFSRSEIPNRNDGDGSEEMGLMGLGRTEIESSTVTMVSSAGGVRLISDLDDTIKHSDILAGPREVFRNVFCRPLEDICVPDMDKLYRSLAQAGLSGLHFVLLLLEGELKTSLRKLTRQLKFYGGRSIVTSLFEPPGERKRPSILEIMDAFNESTFILIGDSGEQDLELYLSIARERPRQVLAVLIRDVTSGRAEYLRQVPMTSASLAFSSPSPASTPVVGNDVEGSAIAREGSAATEGRTRSTAEDDVRASAEEYQALSSAQQKILKRASQWDSRVAWAMREVPNGSKIVWQPNSILTLRYYCVLRLYLVQIQLSLTSKMSDKITVTIKHAGTSHPVEVDVGSSGLALKNSIYQLTGVPIERMKVMIKGGILKVGRCRDEQVWVENEPGPTNRENESVFGPYRPLFSVGSSVDVMLTFARKSRLSRLPSNLVIHMVVTWKFALSIPQRKKAKIMRKVKFPLQLDALDLPVNTAVKVLLKERDDRAKNLKRTLGKPTGSDKSETELRDEEYSRVETLARENGLEESGINPSGMYELCGASADSDNSYVASGEEEWYKYDDDKVSVVRADKILSMDGGGEDSVAYILMYR
ncbi:pre-60S factor REI1, partial [Tremellales sp. Uapishka_1]